MRIVIAKTAGFCMGVRRAVEIALDAANRKKRPIYTYGPLIHNPQVLAILAEKGINVLDSVPEHGTGTVIIRAHGIPPREQQALVNAGFEVIDATCPRVIKVQSIIRAHAVKGYHVIIVGDERHPEVKGLLGYAEGRGRVIGTLEEFLRLEVYDKAIVVAQTTQNSAFYMELKQWIQENRPGYKVFETICGSTERRQAEVKEMAGKVDAVVVVGGYESGNTRRLAQIARMSGVPAYHVESAADLDIPALASANSIGITAGASTPNWIIRQVCCELEERLLKKGTGPGSFVIRLIRNLMLSNLYLAAGAWGLSMAAGVFYGIFPGTIQVAAAVLYLLCMHTANSLLERSYERYSEPDRAAFYDRYKLPLSLLSFVSGAGALWCALSMGSVYFFLYFCMLALGLLYSYKPQSGICKGVLLPRLRDIPGSKTVLTSLAWGISVAMVPAISLGGLAGPGWLAGFVWVVLFVFVRSAYFDIMDMQGSRIVGRETIPIILGEKKTTRLLYCLLAFMALLPAVCYASGMMPAAGMLLSLCPVSVFVFFLFQAKGGIAPGLRRGFLVDTHFVLAGLIGLLVFSLM